MAIAYSGGIYQKVRNALGLSKTVLLRTEPLVRSTNVVHNLGIAGLRCKLSRVNASNAGGAGEYQRRIEVGLGKAAKFLKFVGVHLKNLPLHNHLDRQGVH